VRFLLLIPALACGQGILDHGADVFSKTCASGYCHGPKGAGGGAPKLAARGFDEPFIISVTRAGVEGTAMRGYGTILARPEFNAVVAYVASLNGIQPRTTESEPRRLPPEAARGRDLFFDPVRGFARCSTCHQVDGLGIAVAPITSAPATALELRQLSTPRIETVEAGGDRFPALLVSQGGRRTVLYDLTTLPPVLRTIDSASVRLNHGSTWRHASVLEGYSDAELDSILSFLRAGLALGKR
jgi:mono/diheme cytochrome c family protein